MQVLFIVIPCALVGTAIVLGLDRAGMLLRFDPPERGSSNSARYVGRASSKPVRSVGRPLSLATIVILASWILVWLFVLAVGLNFIVSSS